MDAVQREDIHLICRHGHPSAQAVELALHEHVYPRPQHWQRFFRIVLAGMGLAFFLAGVIFFFAYNWAHLHRFVKLGIVQALLLATAGGALFTASRNRQLLLTAASVLTGVLFAVLGQIYQTGANAYDFFLAWMICIIPWVLIARFAPLWLIFCALLNTTIVLYFAQVASGWSEINVWTVLLIVNTGCWLVARFIGKENSPFWLMQALALAAVSCATMGIITGIFEVEQSGLVLLIVLTAALYAAATMYGVRTQSSFMLALIALSLIVIGATWITRAVDGTGTMLLVGLFIAGGSTLTVNMLLTLQKKWHEQP